MEPPVGRARALGQSIRLTKITTDEEVIGCDRLIMIFSCGLEFRVTHAHVHNLAAC